MKLGIVLFAACSAAAPPEASPTTPASTALRDPALELITTPSPDGHRAFLAAIEGATKSIEMTMFHLTDPAVVDALRGAAARGIQVRVILDGKGLETKKLARVAEELRAAGVDVRGSSAAFSITHEKGMVVDRATAFITAINLTKDAAMTRDFGVITRVHGIVADVSELFEADWDNAANGGNTTPTQHEASLVVSPVSSRAHLTELIRSAKHELVVTVENLGDSEIDDALAAAARKGVTVRLIVPMCDKNPNPLYNFPFATKLASAGVSVQMMPNPESETHPYMHSKMILADGDTAYVGSVNFSTNSTTKARELGLIFVNAAATTTIHAAFEADWLQSVVPPAEPPTDCPSSD
jgi:cardiolipin synthase